MQLKTGKLMSVFCTDPYHSNPVRFHRPLRGKSIPPLLHRRAVAPPPSDDGFAVGLFLPA